MKVLCFRRRRRRRCSPLARTKRRTMKHLLHPQRTRCPPTRSPPADRVFVHVSLAYSFSTSEALSLRAAYRWWVNTVGRRLLVVVMKRRFENGVEWRLLGSTAGWSDGHCW